VNQSLNQILITHEHADFYNKLESCYMKLAELAYFGDGENHIANRKKVIEILGKVAKDGDNAVAEFTEQFDKVKLTPEQFKVSEKELKNSHDEIDKKLLKSLQQAIENVRKYQQEIFVGKSIPGKIKYTPIKRVGICVPGVSAPLPSTVIMTAVPAQVAGVKEIAIVSPPRYNGSIHPVTLAVCYELQITEVYRIGGAQAVAALAYETEHIKHVNKIVGPGNQWVQTAKHIVSANVGIDSIAGSVDNSGRQRQSRVGGGGHA